MIAFLFDLISCVIIVLPLLIAVAYFTLIERKILGTIQRRRGPNYIGFMGLLQPLADGLKLFVKEILVPSSSNKILFILAPFITFALSLINWVVLPITSESSMAQINLGMLFVFAVSSLGVYGILMSGWASNSKYAFLGSLRSAAQMLSYEVSIGFIVITLFLCVGSLDFISIIKIQEEIWFVIPFFPLFLIFFTSALAETNRHPFDLPEAEAELVSGYNVEYSAMTFALFSLGEYSNMLIMSAINTILFFGGFVGPSLETMEPVTNFIALYVSKCFIPYADLFYMSLWFSAKLCVFVAAYVFMRAALPRYRYDQLMDLGWKVFLPISLAYIVLTAAILEIFNMLPA